MVKYCLDFGGLVNGNKFKLTTPIHLKVYGRPVFPVPARVQVLRRSLLIASLLTPQRATYASKLPLSVFYHQTDMPRSEKGKQFLGSRLLHATILTPGFRNRSPSPSLPQCVTGTEFVTRVFARQTVQLGFIPPPDISEHEIAEMNTAIPLANRAPSTTQAPPITKSPGASGGPSDNFNPQDNLYAAIGRLPISVVPATHTQQMGSVAYEGLKTVLQGLYDCSDMFLPLKTVAGGLLTIFRVVDVRGVEAWFMNCYFMNHFCGLDGVREQNGTRRFQGKGS